MTTSLNAALALLCHRPASFRQANLSANSDNVGSRRRILPHHRSTLTFSKHIFFLLLEFVSPLLHASSPSSACLFGNSTAPLTGQEYVLLRRFQGCRSDKCFFSFFLFQKSSYFCWKYNVLKDTIKDFLPNFTHNSQSRARVSQFALVGGRAANDGKQIPAPTSDGCYCCKSA